MIYYYFNVTFEMMRAIFILLIFLLSSCGRDKAPLNFSLSVKRDRRQQQDDDHLAWERQLREEKKREWEEITAEAKEDYKYIKHVIKKKCSSCHDSRRKLPLYGRVFPRYNPVKRHRDEGLRGLDFSNHFPLKANGDPPQLSLLKSFRDAVVRRTMPIKSYIFVYPFRKLNREDEKRILYWIDPLIEKLESFDEKYSVLIDDSSTKGQINRLFLAKCYQCHGRGNNRGKFGGMDKLDDLLKRPKYVDLNNPENSLLYKLSANGEMPTNPRERLNAEELELILEWISKAPQSKE